MKLTIFAALLMMSLSAFATGEQASTDTTDKDCDGKISTTEGTKVTPTTQTTTSGSSTAPVTGNQ